MHLVARSIAWLVLGMVALLTAAPAFSEDFGISLWGGDVRHGWSVSVHDRYFPSGLVYDGYGRHYVPSSFVLDRWALRNHRYRDHLLRSYLRRDPWCAVHRVYHVHDRSALGYIQGYRDGYADGYRDGRYDRDRYDSAAYYDWIEDLAYDTRIYYGRRW